MKGGRKEAIVSTGSRDLYSIGDGSNSGVSELGDGGAPIVRDQAKGSLRIPLIEEPGAAPHREFVKRGRLTKPQLKRKALSLKQAKNHKRHGVRRKACIEGNHRSKNSEVRVGRQVTRG